MNSSHSHHTGEPLDDIMAGKTIDAAPVNINLALIGATLVGATRRRSEASRDLSRIRNYRRDSPQGAGGQTPPNTKT